MVKINCKAFVFTISDECGHSNYVKGEKNLYNAINVSLFDGIIIMPFTFKEHSHCVQFIEQVKENSNIPIVSIGEKNMDCVNVWHDNRKEFAEIIRHLIEEHQCKSIYCLTGFKTSLDSVERLNGYRDEMDKHDLYYGDDTEFYGDYWHTSGEKMASFLLKGGKLPDAVACANDYMAIGLCDSLRKAGIKIPDQIRITGFDRVSEAIRHTPSITTYLANPYKLGQSAFVKLLSLFNGIELSTSSEKLGDIICGGSCCKEYALQSNVDNLLFSGEQKLLQNYLDPYPTNQIMSERNLDGFCQTAARNMYTFVDKWHDKIELYLCLCSDWNDIENPRTNGYSSQIRCIELYGKKEWLNIENMLPKNLMNHPKYKIYHFSSLHFGSDCFGYSVLLFKDIDVHYNVHYQRFCIDINNGLELLCAREHLKKATYLSYQQSIRDTLTGLYNFSIFERFSQEYLASVHDNKSLFLVGVSISNLNNIIELYGQAHGDEMILLTAQILMSCCRNREICIRAKSNEFIILGLMDNNLCSLLKNDILNQFNRYNDSNRENHIIRICISSTSVKSDDDLILTYNKLESELISIKNEQQKKTDKEYIMPFGKLRDEIYKNPELHWTMNCCALKVGLSCSQFQRIYKKIFNVTCRTDIQNSKLLYAKKLLLNTNYTLQTIAEKCGYDYSHFMRLFHQKFNITPTEFRNNQG